MLLTDRERAQAMVDVARLIHASGQTAVVQRIVPGERLYGSDDATYSDLAKIPLEFNENPVGFKNSSTAKTLRTYHDLGENLGKYHPRQTRMQIRDIICTA
jgi:hypothetical protein